MLTENDIIRAVADHLRNDGWAILSSAGTTQTGIDILARRGAETLCVEAKGATSSKPGTARHGVPFSPAQVLSHVARALYAAAVVVTDGHGTAALAFPASPDHRRRLERIRGGLRGMKARVFLVRDDRSVEDWIP